MVRKYQKTPQKYLKKGYKMVENKNVEKPCTVGEKNR